jgi:hypothetical protein
MILHLTHFDPQCQPAVVPILLSAPALVIALALALVIVVAIVRALRTRCTRKAQVSQIGLLIRKACAS